MYRFIKTPLGAALRGLGLASLILMGHNAQALAGTSASTCKEALLGRTPAKVAAARATLAKAASARAAPAKAVSARVASSQQQRESTMLYKAIAFDKLRVEDYKSTFGVALQKAEQNIKAISNSSQEPSFANTIEALEEFSRDLDDWGHVFFNLLMVRRTEKTQSLAKDFLVQQARLSNDVYLNSKLFNRIQQVYNNKENLNLGAEQKRLLKNVYDKFRRGGVLLNKEAQQKLRQMNEQMASLGVSFEDNVLKATNDFLFVTQDPNDVKGIPEQALEAARELAQKKQKTGWAFSLHQPSFEPVIKYSQARHVREELYRAYASRAFQGQYDNQNIIQRLVKLRGQRAKLLGYSSHADYKLEDRMAKNAKNVHAFLNKLAQKVLPAARQEFEKIKALAAADGVSDFRPWDLAYYSHKLEEKELNFDAEQLRPYFELDKVVQGAFAHANKLYGLEFKQVKLPVYHKDVRAYEVFDANKRFMALLYADFFPREDKRNGAWMTFFKGQKNKYQHRPHVQIVMNFTQATRNTPALLTLREVETLFHEFGHALHQMLSCCEFESLSGTNVSWDFVELPSQIMENWVHHREGLDLFARHYKTGQPVPDDFVNKIQKKQKFLSALGFLRQLKLATLDLAWHGEGVLQRLDQLKGKMKKSDNLVDVFEREVCEPFRLFDKHDRGLNTSCGFTHIFSGGYSAGYYSYKWAEVLDADAFELFEQKGIFNSEVAESFRQNILSRGDTDEPEKLYRQFRGRDPQPDALLRRAGLQ